MDRISWWRTGFDNGESDAIKNAIENEHVSQGPIVAEFEHQLASYLDVPYVIATTNGSMALLMSLWASGIGPGDEVIVPNRTWIATAHAPLLLGATIKLVDVEISRPIIDVELIESAITNKTKAIIPVHLCGRSADMQAINNIAQRNNLIVIEDAAQALGSKNHDGFLGVQSDMGCFSFSVAKIISTGQGGCVVTKRKDVYKKLIAMRTHGVGDVVNAKWNFPGFNFRFTDILASIGIAQLGQLSIRIEKAKEIYQLYLKGLDKLSFIKIIPVDIESGEVPVYVEALCDCREDFIKYLSDRKIDSRPFYPNLNKAHYFNENRVFPRSETFGNKGMYLPAGPEQSLSNINKVINIINEFNR